ncbi:MAG: 16S rRNA (cytosine(1402)-N(4))-methyltransferase RsmH [Gammaproteobacteria bacterium]|nr:16S rRNA (cytosine(1402)-N(4))-methyltransferase RsmH [Gammaproteobacteria bacterium]MDP2140187.1 16S rRNA (cytosine(1402)-N(4))-methyltransferase RsmH [Gammaproteobacteria bacterium]MDP2348063.1 16S rRNA (cytosine(1402)-N(4))-methyltransferase RsmH [Gammaproteobacteria bacterium]
MTDQSMHETVLLEPAVAALVTDDAGFYVDGTFGRGGHSRLILKGLRQSGRLLAIDKDPEAVRAARTEFGADERFEIVQGSFSRLGEFVTSVGRAGKVNGVLLDLGVSSPQLDEARRGFSFTQDGPLDMRMNPNEGQSAAQWLASAPEQEIADVIYRYGEERFSRRMARAIVEQRKISPISGTLQLAEIIKNANPAWEKHKHPATRAFQAIRIHINSELDDLQSVLGQALDVLCVGGRLAVISFHSLEDRIVKQFISEQAKGDDYPAGVPVQYADLNPRMKKVGKPVKAGDEELRGNPRSRSAIMRVAEKTA